MDNPYMKYFLDNLDENFALGKYCFKCIHQHFYKIKNPSKDVIVEAYSECDYHYKNLKYDKKKKKPSCINYERRKNEIKKKCY